MQILFHARARRGLGHLVRLGAIASAIAERRPDIDLVVAVSHEAPRELIGHGARLIVHGDVSLAGVMLAPDLVVFDTMLPDLAAPPVPITPRTAVALVLRALRPDALDRLRRHPALRRIDRILIPHEPAEFDPGLALSEHVGPIARLPAGGTWRGRFPLDRPLVVSTTGGGGHRELCETFIDTVLAADRRLRRDGHEFHHLLVTGPRYTGPVPASGPVEISRFEPLLPGLFDAADLVVARAGYNTVQELAQTATPAILVPGNPRLDDQVARARRMAELDRFDVVPPGDVDGLASAMDRRLRADRDNERRLRVEHDNDRRPPADRDNVRRLGVGRDNDRCPPASGNGLGGVTPGAHRAAQLLLELVETVVRRSTGERREEARR